MDTRFTDSIAKNRQEGKRVVATPGPSPGQEHAGHNCPEAFGLGLGANKEAKEGEEEHKHAGRKLPFHSLPHPILSKSRDLDM